MPNPFDPRAGSQVTEGDDFRRASQPAVEVTSPEREVDPSAEDLPRYEPGHREPERDTYTSDLHATDEHLPGERVRYEGVDDVVSSQEGAMPTRSPEEAAGSPLTGPVREGVAETTTPRIIAVANQKGGVGKTTTTVNMGAALAELGHRVLIVDLDPQGNATTGLGINYRVLDQTMYDVMLSGLPIDDCIEPTEVKGLFVAPASLDLAGAEVELVSSFNRESKLARTLDEVADQYDYILIDCPPSLGLLTVNGLVAATEVMVPIQCEYYALEGLAQLTRNIELIRDNLNPGLHIANIVMVMYDNRTKLAEQVVSEVRDHFGSIVCRNMIPRNIKLSEAPSFGQPITIYASASRGAVAYRELAREVSGVS